MPRRMVTPLKVKFNQSIAGADFSYGYGQIADIDSDWAKNLIESGLADRAEEGEPSGANNNSSTGDRAGDAGGNKAVSKARRK